MPSTDEVLSVVAQSREWLMGRPTPESPMWKDFASTAGSSTEWVTGFVLWALCPEPSPSGVVQQAKEALLACQRDDGSWGFCAVVPGDTDSTAWAVTGLGDALPSEPRAKALSYLLAQQVGGAFRTYSSSAARPLVPWAPRAPDFRGWTAAHTCVTAVAVGSLVGLGLERDDPSVCAAINHLERRQATEGVWPSYWWSGIAYSTYHALCALAACGALRRGTLEAARDGVLRRQLQDGGWAWDAGSAGRSGAFETAFAIMSLALARRTEPSTRSGILDEPIDRGIQWLCRHQTAPGRWRAEPILRVPLPNDAEEHLGAHECRPRSGGLGADINRVFAAAAVLRCLVGHLGQHGEGDGLPGTRRSRVGGTRADGERQQGDRARGPVLGPVLRMLVVHEATLAFSTGMRQAGLSVTASAREEVLLADRTLGEHIAARLPGPPRRRSPGRDGPSVFSGRWWSKIPSVLGFGAAMTKVLASAQGLRCAPAAAELGAVLFLGTAALDHLCDESPDRQGELLDILTPEKVAALCRAGSPPAEVVAPGAAPHDDVHYVLSLVGEFFARFGQLLEPGPARARAAALLESAYNAERRTLLGGEMSPAEGGADAALEYGMAARVLPFMVVSALNCAAARPSHDCATGWACHGSARLLGRAVAVLDDLADLPMDARLGSHNSILGTLERRDGNEGEASKLLVQVLATGACWRAAQVIVADLAQLMKGAPALDPLSRQRLLSHLWGWGNLGVPSTLPGWQARAGTSGRVPPPRRVSL